MHTNQLKPTRDKTHQISKKLVVLTNIAMKVQINVASESLKGGQCAETLEPALLSWRL